jgi:arginine-tRNA-protein transferase
LSKGQSLELYISRPDECSYLPGRNAVNVFADPHATMSVAVYTVLIRHGFRRSGELVYRPHCPGCNACVPIRIPTARFAANRSQRRNWRQNADLRAVPRNDCYRDEHFRLYEKYLAHRHPGGGMDNPTPESFTRFLRGGWCDTRFVEFRSRGRLLAVAVHDRLGDGLSAVYTFFDPEHRQRGLGKFAILWLIHEARRLGLAHLYLGYWIGECDKMRYKTEYRPVEIYHNERWQPLHLPSLANLTLNQ